MKAEQVRESLYARKAVVVLREKSAAAALGKAKALAAGGMRSLEFTWTTPDAAKAVAEAVREKLGVVGAGSILTVAQAKQAVDAGAMFLVSPVLVPAVVAFAKRAKVLLMGGALTPQEILEAWEAGCRPVKVFPISAVGGASYLKSVLGPMPFLELCPTGGVNLASVADYLAAGAKLVGLGESFTRLADERDAPGSLTRRAEDARVTLGISR